MVDSHRRVLCDLRIFEPPDGKEGDSAPNGDVPFTILPRFFPRGGNHEDDSTPPGGLLFPPQRVDPMRMEMNSGQGDPLAR